MRDEAVGLLMWMLRVKEMNDVHRVAVIRLALRASRDLAAGEDPDAEAVHKLFEVIHGDAEEA